MFSLYTLRLIPEFMQLYIVNLKALQVQFLVSPCIVQVVDVDMGFSN